MSIILSVSAFLLVLGYVIYDNHRIVVRKETVEIKGLSEELDGFRVLQISDFQEAVFGKDNSPLVERIHGLDYDIIVLTGDVMNRSTNKDYRVVYRLLEDLKDMGMKRPVFYVEGNHDPASYEYRGGRREKSDFVKGLEKRGVELLEEGKVLPRAGVRVIIENVGSTGAVIDTLENLLEEKKNTRQDKEDGDLLLGITHYPLVPKKKNVLPEDKQRSFRKDYDLVLSGHYHGGQFRVPFFGTFYVPDRRLKFRGFFPPQKIIRWFSEVDGVRQYVSAGLGTSGLRIVNVGAYCFEILNFRLFCPPEINLLIFTKKK